MIRKEKKKEKLLRMRTGRCEKMSGIILYKSKYGATKQYAEWISERTGFICKRTDEADIKDILKYDVIILGGGIYASGIAGISFLKKNIGKLKGKKILVFCCGASPYEQSSFETVVKHNFKDALSGIPCFYCRGTFDMSAMSFKDRTLCRLLRKAVSKKKPDEYEVWEKALMAVEENERGDWIDKAYIEPVIKAL